MLSADARPATGLVAHVCSSGAAFCLRSPVAARRARAYPPTRYGASMLGPSACVSATHDVRQQRATRDRERRRRYGRCGTRPPVILAAPRRRSSRSAAEREGARAHASSTPTTPPQRLPGGRRWPDSRSSVVGYPTSTSSSATLLDDSEDVACAVPRRHLGSVYRRRTHFSSVNTRWYRNVARVQCTTRRHSDRSPRVRRAATTTPCSSTGASTGRSASRSTRRRRRPASAARPATPSSTSAARWARATS